MTERHFHGQRHIRGGFDFSEDAISPNANYWFGSAIAEFQRLERLIGTEKAKHVAPDRQQGQTWRDIYEAVKILADLAEKQILANVQESKQEVGDLYDFTPFPKEMPDIDFEAVDEIPF